MVERAEVLGNWKENIVRGDEPEGKVLGILGMGEVGKVNPESAETKGVEHVEKSSCVWYEDTIFYSDKVIRR